MKILLLPSYQVLHHQTRAAVWRIVGVILFLHLGFSTIISAQNKLWDKTYGANNYDNLNSLQQTSDGGYILGGSSKSRKNGDKSEDNHKYVNFADYWVVKLNADGSKAWDKTIGGNFDDDLVSVQQSRDGGYILAGNSRSGKSGDKTEAHTGAWLVKLKADGSKVWDKTFGGGVSSVQQTSDEGYILGGGSGGDYWLVKLKADGSKEWDKTFGGKDRDNLSSIQQTSDGGYILGGYSESGISGDKTEANSGPHYTSDYWVVKVTADGSKVWDKTIGGSSHDFLASLQQTLDGGYILGGTSESATSGNKSEPSKLSDYWVIKLKADGNIEWDKTISGNGSEKLAVVQQTLDGSYILGGSSSSGKSGDKSQSSRGNNDYWIVKLKADGSRTWDKTIGGGSVDLLSSLQQTSDGGYILGGSSWSNIGGDKSESTRGQFDYWVVRLDNKEINLSQIVTFKPILDKQIGEVPFALSAQASSGLPVTFNVVSGPAKISGNMVTLTGTGTITVRAAVAGNATYQPAEAIQSFLVEASMVKMQWDKTIGSDATDFLTSVQQTKDGGYILGGTSDSGISGDKIQASRGDKDYWIVKLQADGTKEWDKTLGGNNFDDLTSMQQTRDGGYILGGTSYSGKGGNKSEANKGFQGSTDYWVVKLRADGSKEWDKTIGGDAMDILTSMQQTSDGGYILGGTSGSGKSGDKSQASRGYYEDYWIVKLQVDGTKQWDKTIGGNSGESLAALQQTRDGGYILGGYSDSDKSGDKSEPSPGNWIVKLNADGSKVWDKTIGGIGSNDDLTSVQQTSDDGYIFGASNYSDASYIDYWIVKLNADGTKEWDKTFGGDGYDKLASAQQTPDGGYILGGYSESGISGDKTQVNKDNNYVENHNGDYWVVKLSTDGSKEWDRTIGGNRGDHLRSLQQTQDGGYILGGSSSSGIDGDKTEVNRGPFSTFDYWIVKLKEEQPLTASWNMRYGGSGKDNFTTVIKTSDGGYLSGGYTTSGASGDKSQSSQGKNDYWIVKSDKNGKKQWDKRYGGTGEDYLSSIVQTSDGDYLLGGSSVSGVNGDKTQDSRGERDYWVMKIDKQGNKQWDKRYGGSGTEELKQVRQMPSGSFILAGTSNSPLSGDISQASYGGQDYWVIKINRSGKKIWDKRYGGAQDEELADLVFTQDGGFLVGGSSLSGISGTKSQASQGASDYWVVRLTGEGEPVWDQRYGGSGEDYLMALGSTGTSTGNFFLAGTSTSGKSGDKSQPSQGGTDYWLLKITGTGKKIWDKRYGGSKDEELRTVHMTPEGGYLLGGSSNSGVSGNKSQASQGASDYWLVKTSATGVKEWDQRFGGTGKEELRSVLLNPDGGYLLAGRSDSGVSGDRTQPTQGGTDYWLVKVAPTSRSMIATRETTEVGEPVIKNESFHLQAFPNPVKETATIRFTLPQTQPTTVKIYDSQGRETATLFQGEAQANQTYQVEWQAGKQASGMYLLQLQTPTRQSTQKLLLAK